MILMQGKGVSQEEVKGRLYFSSAVQKESERSPENEKKRLGRDQNDAMSQLVALAEKTTAETSEESAIRFGTRVMFAEDDDYVECIMDTLDKEHYSAEYAVQQAGEQFSAMFVEMEDPYMQARSSDIKDVTQSILNNLMGIGELSVSPLVLLPLRAGIRKSIAKACTLERMEG